MLNVINVRFLPMQVNVQNAVRHFARIAYTDTIIVKVVADGQY